MSALEVIFQNGWTYAGTLLLIAHVAICINIIIETWKAKS